MAFPVPAHLPGKKELDVSTTVLSKMSETSLKALNNDLTSKWIAELDVAIRQTKVRLAIRKLSPARRTCAQERIHERVQADLPAFERQLASSKSVQERLQTLSSNVDRLQDTLSNPQVRPPSPSVPGGPKTE